MPLTVALTHRTRYGYDRLVGLGPHVLRLRPAPHCRTPILAYALKVEPAQHFINWQQDPFGNYLARVVVPEATRELVATVDLVADMATINPFDFFVEDGAAQWPFAYSALLAGELAPYLEAPPPGPGLARYIAGIDTAPRGTVDFICDLNRSISRDVAYRIRMEPGVQDPDETLALASGSCRDSGWLLVQVLRRLGLAARFVSGYLIQLRPDAPSREGAAGPAEDFTDLHAWAEVYVPGAGWIGLDATSGLLAGEGHIPLAATPSPISAAPITGTHGLAEVDFSVSMHVQRVSEAPRVSKPYTEATWQAILEAGDAIEARLAEGDVRLSVGGEPTFVAKGGGLEPEWFVAAQGPSKRGYADTLARALLARLAPGGLLQHGQGKWYPGESTARWAYSVYWRSDGKPLWHDPALIATENPVQPAGICEAERVAAALAQRLGLSAGAAIPAYEDRAHFLLIEQRLPLEVAPADNRLADEAERARLVRAFDRGLDTPAGFVLPLLVRQERDGRLRFLTERWAFKRGQLVLVPGDSPIGLRLPLASLAEIAFIDFPDVQPRDPFADPRPLGSGAEVPTADGTAATPTKAGEPVRTALAIEPRAGHLCVFLPPLSDAAAYAALIAAIEAAAAESGIAVRLEGYPPPYDPRLNAIKVTPDPGVIEVNVHPARTWREAVDIAGAVYEEADQAGLTAEKFMLDGRHVGTGGGSHIVLGGATPADSPFLRRPDLLASIIGCWQNHPALSYLFSGLFVGPTSQAPRIDEARHDSLYELEIALRQVPQPGGTTTPWLLDRLFRNLLVDATGNTHRAEICIDKLYAPAGPMGRLGLVEFRAFEMAPHARMGLVQQLLIRALVAWFWREPYRRPLVRWGTSLHDRFMLPHFVWADLENLLAELAGAGLRLEADWFCPHFEFRFPVLGAVERGGVELELRQALEPWLVLGEQDGPSGAARPVDASLDRLQAVVRGARPDRHVVTCNGYALPLTATGTTGEQVAGVRFRAWKKVEGFHPLVPPHVPLTFDVVDTWNGRSLGGCCHHAAHPGGRNFETLPVNALEAEGRRRARFEATGHSPGRLTPRFAGVHPDFPLTLDLRRVP